MTPSAPPAVVTRTTKLSSAPSARALTVGSVALTDAISPTQVRS